MSVLECIAGGGAVVVADLRARRRADAPAWFDHPAGCVCQERDWDLGVLGLRLTQRGDQAGNDGVAIASEHDLATPTQPPSRTSISGPTRSSTVAAGRVDARA